MTIAKKFSLHSSDRKADKPVKTKNGKVRAFFSKLSGAFMLPIAVMAIAGLLLGIGATIEGSGMRVNPETFKSEVANIHLVNFGLFIKNMGQPVFSFLPLLFALSIIIAFTNEAGVGVFAGVVGYGVFIALQSALIIPASNANGTPLKDADNKQMYYVLFDKGEFRSPQEIARVIDDQLGFKSLQTSIFGGIVVGFVVAWLYNKLHTIQLPQIISFFGGKRFVALSTLVAMVPLALIFLILWPYLGAGLNALGTSIGKAPGGTDSLVFGYIERSLIPFGLHHAFYAPLWYTQVGGSVTEGLKSFAKVNEEGQLTGKIMDPQAAAALNLSAPEIAGWVGDSTISSRILGLPFNEIRFVDVKSVQGGANTINAWKGEDWTTNPNVQTLPVMQFFKQELGINVGRFMQGKYPFMQFGLPAAGLAMILAAPKENRKLAAGSVVPSSLTALVTGVTEPIEFTFLFLTPLMFWGFHASVAALSFMFMNLAGAHIGMAFSGGILDLIIYGIVPVQKGTEFWWWIVIGLPMIPLYFFVFYFVIKKFDLATPGRGSNTKLFNKKDFLAKKDGALPKQLSLIVDGMGGWDNIVVYNNCASRLRYDVKDTSKVSEEKLKAAGALGVQKVGSNVQAIFGPVAEQLNSKIVSMKNAPLTHNDGVQSEPTVATKVASDGKLEKVHSVVKKGKVKSLSTLKDGVFSEKMLGDGVVVELDPKAKMTKFYAPISGKLETVFTPGGHAYGIVSDSGLSVLLHIGIDTVNLKGEGFHPVVKQGDHVKAGDLLVEVDVPLVRSKAPSVDAIVIVTPESSKTKVSAKKKDDVTGLTDTLFTVK
ncbi:glucose PTS transporter subunit IIA [Candidatus Mycoplasma pogonae]